MALIAPPTFISFLSVRISAIIADRAFMNFNISGFANGFVCVIY
jgi:hypothetical protein